MNLSDFSSKPISKEAKERFLEIARRLAMELNVIRAVRTSDKVAYTTALDFIEREHPDIEDKPAAARLLIPVVVEFGPVNEQVMTQSRGDDLELRGHDAYGNLITQLFAGPQVTSISIPHLSYVENNWKLTYIPVYNTEFPPRRR